MIFVAQRRASSPEPIQEVRAWFAAEVARRVAADGLTFAGLILWDVCPTEVGWVHRIEVELAEAGDRRPTGCETIAALMSADEFRACAREVRAL